MGLNNYLFSQIFIINYFLEKNIQNKQIFTEKFNKKKLEKIIYWTDSRIIFFNIPILRHSVFSYSVLYLFLSELF